MSDTPLPETVPDIPADPTSPDREPQDTTPYPDAPGIAPDQEDNDE